MEARRATDIYLRAEQQLAETATAIQRQDRVDLESLVALAKDIAESIGYDDQLVVQALAGPTGSSLVTNLINVSILATKVGAGLGYYGKELQRLSLAGLVHDIGLFAVPQSIVTKSGRLTREERTLIEQHPELGYQLVRKLGPEWEWLSHVVRQAHERWNGQGYPNRLKGRDINEFAQIIGAVDVFDALVTPRPYRRRFFPHEAVRELLVAERMAFPREIIKALVEQLSAYPLGTLVRLTTGEVGTVVGINARFPLRPVVEVGGGPVQGSGQESRQLDLSESPLVSIVETVESPAVSRVPFPSAPSTDRRTKSGPTVSDQFSSLLESLDALANAIQGVVDAKVPATSRAATEPQQQVEDRGSGRASGQEFTDPSFEKEVIGLFALEAHEWLAQIHSALKRLGEGANGTVRHKLYGIILQGLTNLAKAAATVHLTAIEDMASGLLPILHGVGGKEPGAMAAALASLQSGIDRITTAVRHAEGGPGTEEPVVEPASLQAGAHVVEDNASHAPILSESSTFTPVTATSGVSLLNALRDLQQVRSRSVQPARDVLEAVLLRAEQEAGTLSVAGIRRILDDLDEMDERFMKEVSRRVPLISQILTDLLEDGTRDFVTASQLDPIVDQVEALHDVAASVQAGMMTMFLEGLRSFLMVAAYRKAATLPQRLATVEARIQALIPMAEQWVSIGRVERAAIAEILPAS
ncbi:MAG TPA: HD domain-containing phosphohydrolase [Nitrospira sp.]|nr:HD domain-containing phosphohydrolase [Nitrospira sp.]